MPFVPARDIANNLRAILIRYRSLPSIGSTSLSFELEPSAAPSAAFTLDLSSVQIERVGLYRDAGQT